MHAPGAYGQCSVFDHNGDKQSAVLGTRFGTWWPWYGQLEVGWLQPLQLWLSAGVSSVALMLVSNNRVDVGNFVRRGNFGQQSIPNFKLRMRINLYCCSFVTCVQFVLWLVEIVGIRFPLWRHCYWQSKYRTWQVAYPPGASPTTLPAPEKTPVFAAEFLALLSDHSTVRCSIGVHKHVADTAGNIYLHDVITGYWNNMLKMRKTNAKLSCPK